MKGENPGSRPAGAGIFDEKSIKAMQKIMAGTSPEDKARAEAAEKERGLTDAAKDKILKAFGDNGSLELTAEELQALMKSVPDLEADLRRNRS
ncbi:MAG: hypothetical protein ABIJ46_02925 [bacterium]